MFKISYRVLWPISYSGIWWTHFDHDDITDIIQGNITDISKLADPTQLQLSGVELTLLSLSQEEGRNEEETTPSFYQKEWPYMFAICGFPVGV